MNLRMWLFVIAFLIPTELLSEEIRRPPQIITGQIEEVSYNSIKINGVWYSLAKASIITTKGIKSGTDSLQIGIPVELLIENGEVKTIYISDKLIVR